jgi:hypothetical protein
MIPLSIRNATAVYDNASRCEIYRHSVDHPGLADISRTLRALFQSLGDEADDEFWRKTLSPIRRLAFTFCSVPLPYQEVIKAIGTDWDKIHRQVRLCEQMFPDSHQELANLVNQLEELSTEGESPLITPLENLIQSNSSLAVMIRNPQMNQATAAYFSNNRKLCNARIVSPTQLRGPYVCNILATIGPCAWFPEYVFSAPRVGAIHIISFRWIRDSWKPGPIFLHSSEDSADNSHTHRIGVMPRVATERSTDIEVPPDIQPTDLLPPLPTFTRIANHTSGSHSESGRESVAARLCHLSGGRAVFVATDEGVSSLIIDTSETGRTSVRRSHCEELEPGFYLLLRTSGGGDLIKPLADRILGDLALDRRSQQSEWKKALLSVASERFGPLGRRELASRVATELRLQNLSQARSANVYYWMSEKCISPRKLEDFQAIMTFAGIQERTEELWKAMQDIDRAHKRAGFLIRRMLLQKIAETSLEPLERDGEMIFDLEAHDGGTLSAFQIAAIQDEEFEVPADRIGILLDTEE